MSDATGILSRIDPARLQYDEWLAVGMALKDAGGTAADWEQWSRQDSERYVQGECIKKWESFRGSGKPITVASLVKLAKEQGYRPQTGPIDAGRELDWQAVIGGKEPPQTTAIEEPENWQPARDLISYLSNLFDSDEHVGYVTESWYNEKAGRYLPKKGCWDRTAGELIEALQKCDGDLGQVLGDYNPEVGAWIRFNPVDGQGIRDENVTAYRFALIESDEIPVDKQHALIQELELPVAALVHSGGKSLHAIVRVDADNYDEYRKRVDFLYEVCERNGLQMDRQNRNPSRLSRMPGVTRNDQRQYLVATNIGKSTWAEWVAGHGEPTSSILPVAVDAAQWLDEQAALPMPETILADFMIAGSKAMVAGPSKARKSFFVLELAVRLSMGSPRFLCFKIPAPRRVLLIQPEITAAMFQRRLRNTCTSLAGFKARELLGDRLKIVNCRGYNLGHAIHSETLRAMIQEHRADVIVLDPVYKALETGREDSEDFRRLLATFDAITEDTGACVVFVHHYAKGTSGDKSAIDRGAGSGWVGRDMDNGIYLDQHATEDEALVLTPICRNFPPMPPVCCRFGQAGLFDLQPDIEPDVYTSRTRTSQKRKTAPELTPEKVQGLLSDGPIPATRFREHLKALPGMTQKAARAAYDDLLASGQVVKSGRSGRNGVHMIGTPEQIESVDLLACQQTEQTEQTDGASI